MTGTLLPAPTLRAVDANGVPISGAQLQFYVTTTTTPTPVYTNSGLGTQLSNPVVADSGGLFPPMYLDPAVVYRAKLLNATGGLIQDIDPITFTVAPANQTEVNAGSVTDKYVAPSTLAAWTGVAGALGYTPLNKAGDTATNLVINDASTPAIKSAGYLGAPVNEQDGTYAIALTDSGKMIRHNSASAHAWTINPVATTALPVDTVLVFRNIGAGVVTITRGTGVTLRIAGSATSQNVALAQWGFATTIMEDTNTWVISGTGIS